MFQFYSGKSLFPVIDKKKKGVIVPVCSYMRTEQAAVCPSDQPVNNNTMAGHYI